jgi:DNA (cytosine-5)-methyltransferase 1
LGERGVSAWAYYNEFEPHAAAWLRNLIALGVIAPGEVDERSILDVAPDDLRGFRQCHFFAGIGVWSYAARLAGWDDDRPLWTGSCPCQPFSAAGKGGGFADERHLWPAFHHLIDQRRPVRVYGEQVEGPAGRAWLDLVSADVEGIGYALGSTVFPSASLGAPHGRHRTYWMADSDLRRSIPERREPGEQSGERLGRRQFGTGVEVGRLADDNATGRCVIEAQPLRQAARDAYAHGLRRSIGLADAGSAAGQRDARSVSSSQEGIGRTRIEHGDLPVRHSDGFAVGGVAEPDEGQRGRRSIYGERQRDGQDGGRSQDYREPTGRRQIGLLVEPERARLEGQRRDGGDRDQPGREREIAARPASAAGGAYGERPGPTNGFWRDADWLFCRDAKWRPVEPGTFPLVDGSAFDLDAGGALAGKNRAKLLAGYGNAINAQQAAEFIRSTLDA